MLYLSWAEIYDVPSPTWIWSYTAMGKLSGTCFQAKPAVIIIFDLLSSIVQNTNSIVAFGIDASIEGSGTR